MSPSRPVLEWLQNRAFGILQRLGYRPSSYRYWALRARKYGTRSVLNIGHTDAEVQSVTRTQREFLFPLLRQHLRATDKRLLDFGCGPGRFTCDLARLIGGSVVGVDPVAHYLSLAPQHEHVAYRRLRRGVIPAPDASFDVVWICLVIGGILDASMLTCSVREIDRVLAPGGLIFLIENTSEQPDVAHWVFRSVDEYARIFPFATLTPAAEYFDLNERISVLTGRKHE